MSRPRSRLLARVNAPFDAGLVERLFRGDPRGLRLAFPRARVPFDGDQWGSLFPPGGGNVSLVFTLRARPIGHSALLRKARRRWLCFVYLRPACRGRGLSAALLRLTEEFAAGSLGARALWLNVRSFNAPALRSYERAGYLRHARSGTRVTMRKRLEPKAAPRGRARRLLGLRRPPPFRPQT